MGLIGELPYLGREKENRRLLLFDDNTVFYKNLRSEQICRVRYVSSLLIDRYKPGPDDYYDALDYDLYLKNFESAIKPLRTDFKAFGNENIISLKNCFDILTGVENSWGIWFVCSIHLRKGFDSPGIKEFVSYYEKIEADRLFAEEEGLLFLRSKQHGGRYRTVTFLNAFNELGYNIPCELQIEEENTSSAVSQSTPSTNKKEPSEHNISTEDEFKEFVKKNIKPDVLAYHEGLKAVAKTKGENFTTGDLEREDAMAAFEVTVSRLSLKKKRFKNLCAEDIDNDIYSTITSPASRKYIKGHLAKKIIQNHYKHLFATFIELCSKERKLYTIISN